MNTGNWLIYGATGYSGQLIAEAAVQQNLSPVLAGRSAKKLEPLANKLGLKFRAFDLDDASRLDKQLQDIDFVLHCAGPFSATSAPMIGACIRTGSHYFDISGELRVFEHAHSAEINAAARNKGVIVCPGVGFDVIPTDCLAKTLADEMPDACQLALGFSGFGTVSPGSAKTLIEGLAKPTLERRDGKIVECELKSPQIDFGQGLTQAMQISWGDISTAYYSTGIGNIETYIPATDKMIQQARRAARLRPLLKLSLVQRLLKALVGRSVKGPDQQQRADQRIRVWGEVRNAKGDRLSARIETSNGYQLTIDGALAAARFMLENQPDQRGSLTPSMLMGQDMICRLPECGNIELRREPHTL